MVSAMDGSESPKIAPAFSVYRPSLDIKKTGDGANVPRKVTAEQQTPNQRLGLPWSGSLHAPGKNRCVILTLHTLTGLFSNCK
jgi:hypothetical protein